MGCADLPQNYNPYYIEQQKNPAKFIKDSQNSQSQEFQETPVKLQKFLSTLSEQHNVGDISVNQKEVMIKESAVLQEAICENVKSKMSNIVLTTSQPMVELNIQPKLKKKVKKKKDIILLEDQ